MKLKNPDCPGCGEPRNETSCYVRVCRGRARLSHLCKACCLSREKSRYASDPARARRLALLRKYKLSDADFSLLLARANGVCEICASPFQGAPHVDHCHATGKVRGLLCSQCNTALGLFKDSVGHLRSAVDYLQHNQ